jgi:hypothetical protein
MEKVMNSSDSHIVFIGDSTLDNVYWMTDDDCYGREKCIKEQLVELTGGKVTNYAADGFTSKNVLNGLYPHISYEIRQQVGDPYPEFQNAEHNFKFSPLVHLKKLEGITHAVLSVGGNDIREILGNLNELPNRWMAFNENYPIIVEEILKVTPNLIIQLQYRPSFNQDEHYRVYERIGEMADQVSKGPKVDSVYALNNLMETIYPPIFKIAQDHKIPIIDLTNTYDIYDDSLYRSQIEPSEKGGQLTCELIKHVVENHNFSEPSRLYKLNKEGKVESMANKFNANQTWFIGEKRSRTSLTVMLDMMRTTMMVTNNCAQNQEKNKPVSVVSQPVEPQVDAELEEKINNITQMGFGCDRKAIIQNLKIDGSIETAVSAILSNL